MNLRECYEKMHGDYDDVCERLPREESVIKFLKRFLDDKNFPELMAAVAEEDYEKIFSTTHNLKGICANLSITRLKESSSELCEAVRHGKPNYDIQSFVDKVAKDYEDTKQAISELSQ